MPDFGKNRDFKKTINALTLYKYLSYVIGIFLAFLKYRGSKMNVLVKSNKKYFEKEIREFFLRENARTYFANSSKSAVDTLNNRKIDIMILDFDSLYDTFLLKYVENYHKNIKMILFTDDFMKNAISVFKRSNFTLISEPFKLSKLKKLLCENN